MGRRRIPAGKPKDDRARVVERPDGYYWLAEEAQGEYGPFPTLREAVTNMEGAGNGAYEPGETLAEAEDEIGMSDWIDPDTGEPAEDSIPRTEDH